MFLSDPKRRNYKLDEFEILFHCLLYNEDYFSIKNLFLVSIHKWNKEIKNQIKENLCLNGGTTLLKYFPIKLKKN